MNASQPALLKLAAWAARVLPLPFKRALYKLPFLAPLLRRALNRAAPSGIQEVTIAGGALAGWKAALDLHSEKDYWLGTYEPELQAAAARLLKPDMTVYDVGANIGYISLLAARLNGPDGKVFSFEALPANIGRLRRNLALNALEERVSVIHAAVVAASAPVTFLTHRSGAMGKAQGSAGREEGYQQSIQVDGLALDDFIFARQNLPPALVKMDIEGGEGGALRGMPRILREARPILLIELHGQQAAREVWEQLVSCGYSLCRMGAACTPIHSLADLDWKAYVVALPPGIQVS